MSRPLGTARGVPFTGVRECTDPREDSAAGGHIVADGFLWHKGDGQDAPGKEFGKSITDACLGRDDSERLVFDLADIVSKL